MKVIAFNGSPRKDGNTALLLKEVLKTIEAQGIETEYIQLGGQLVRGCTACYGCFKNQDKQCVVKGDMINECIDKACDADAIIMGTSTYFANVSTELKALIDRLGLVARANEGILRRKIGAGVTAVRRGGAIQAVDAINRMFQINQMLMVGSTYWNFGVGLEKEEVAGDEEGMTNMHDLGETIAWLLKKINS